MVTVLKHTPGPWELASTFPDSDGYKVRGGSLAYRVGNRVIAVVKKAGSAPLVENPQMDAHLIAAAPDLLEACKSIEQWWLTEGNEAFVGAPAGMFMLRAAIAKAEGRA